MHFGAEFVFSTSTWVNNNHFENNWGQSTIYIQERMTCNTFDAHRLVKWAGEHDKQTAMKLSLFDVYFGKGADVCNHHVLLDCVAAVGLNREQAKQVLDSDQYTAEVREEEAVYQQSGVISEPAYIINNKYLISGGQESATFVQAFQSISAES